MQSLLRMMEFLTLWDKPVIMAEWIMTDLIFSNSNISTHRPPATAKASYGIQQFRMSWEIKLYHGPREEPEVSVSGHWY